MATVGYDRRANNLPPSQIISIYMFPHLFTDIQKASTRPATLCMEAYFPFSKAQVRLKPQPVPLKMSLGAPGNSLGRIDAALTY